MMNKQPLASNNTRRVSGYSLQVGEVSRLSDPDDCHVKVAVRCRPMSDRETSDGYQPIVEVESERRIVVHDVSDSPSDQLGTKSGERKNISHVYDFDIVFDQTATQAQIYDRSCRPIVQSVLEGYNGTIFAYGQTGTGKTYTMEGLAHRKSQHKSRLSATTERRASKERPMDGESVGIIPRTFEQIFDHVNRCPSVQFLIRASYLEIYQEEIRDLLKKDKSIKLELHERSDIGVYVKDITSFVCKSIQEIERVMRVGNQNRIVGATDMNEHSSRSHAIFMITIEQLQASSAAAAAAGASKGLIKVGKLNLVDLAGSERQRKTNSLGQRQKESIKINLSLSALGKVINSLMRVQATSKRQQSSNLSATTTIHTPYRDSKLTRLLQDSLGGNAKTLMIANIGPASYNYDETINTLNYASRARCIENRPRLNEDPKDALLRELQQEIESLRKRLAASASSEPNQPPPPAGESIDSTKLNNDKHNPKEQRVIEKELLELRQKLNSLESKLLNGDKRDIASLDKNLLKGYTRDQELELKKRQEELASQAGRERAIRDELERRQEAELLVKQSFDTIQHEVDAKRRMIRQLLLKVKAVRDEIDANQHAHRLELDELDQLQYVLQRELKLKCLIMDNFIPNHHVDQLLSRLTYDEKRNSCSIEPLELPLDCCRSGASNKLKLADFWHPTYDSIRPKSEFERIGEAIYPNNIRYKYKDLIEPKLETPSRYFSIANRSAMATLNNPTTPQPLGQETTRLQALIDSALNQRESDIVI